MVRAGCKIGENAIVGARSVVQSDVPAHHVVVGQPAKSVRIKPGWEDVADPLDGDHRDEHDARRIEYELPADLEAFDEFQRDLVPPNDGASGSSSSS
jgi:maltose O-acetyltransferase